MEIEQLTLEHDALATADFTALHRLDPHLVLVFAAVEVFADPQFAPTLARSFPRARRIGCSTAGEISDEGVSDATAVVTAIRLDTPNFRAACAPLASMERSDEAGVELAAQLDGPDLRSVLILGQGVQINGSALIDGITRRLGREVVLTGGLAGDAGAFKRTWTLFDDAVSTSNIVGIGFYGDAIKMAHGSFGGWQPFGPARKVTRARGNVLHELDGEPALEIYKRYLGQYAKDLPGSGLLFPFAMLGDDHNEVGLIRTILGVDEASRSLILAGDIVENGYLRLMHASTNSLISGAEAAAHAARDMFRSARPGLAILVSCVGRKLVMGGRVDEEVEAVANVFGSGATITGFYSNGEISPYVASTSCELHNQTMTITYLYE
ncbi:MAG TPA: FIST N-terminal domain-containing protein [Burkholderiaceae bacterium]|nr:FIST N-terminal domain-containing protein [Burkholderiaceae bacterium]